VQKLEARLTLTDESIVIRIKYVSPDGTVKDGPLSGIGGLSDDGYQRARDPARI
jgi:hypothetical protein